MDKLRAGKTVSQVKSSKSSHPILSELSEEEKRLHLEFVAAEKYLANYNSNSQKDIVDVIHDAPKLLRAIGSLHTASYQLIQKSIPAYTQLNVDQRLWNVAVHDLVTLGRFASSQKPKLKEAVNNSINHFLEKGVQHLEELLEWIETKCPHTRNVYNGKAEYTSPPSSLQDAEYAAICYPRMLVSLGDCQRYLVNNRDSLRLAMISYEKARGIDPENGRIYHQMGVVTWIRKDLLSTAYNFIRAYSSSNPVEAAKQQLFTVFDDAYKTYQPIASTFWCYLAKRGEILHPDDVRRQIWIFSHGFQKIPQFSELLGQTKEIHLKPFSPQEIYRRFSITYIQVIGKLFTEIGIETLHIVAEESLVYFEGLLNRGNTACFPPIRLIQIMTLNMHILDHLRSKSTQVTWTIAIQYSLEIFSIVTERLTTLITICGWDNPQMEVLTAGLLIWIEWMRLNPKVWSRRRPRPIFSIRHVHQSKLENLKQREEDIWIIFSSLMSKLESILYRFKKILFPSVSDNEDEIHRFCISPFPESKHMYGFLSFRDSQIFHWKYYCDSKRGIARGRNLVRMEEIHKFGIRFLCEKYPILEYKIQNGLRKFSTQMTVRKPTAENEIGGLDRFHYQFWIKNFNQEKETKISIKYQDSNNSNRIILRSSMIKVEVDKTDEIMMTSETLISSQSLLSHNYKLWLYFAEKNFRTEIIVQPSRFVLDTNCFIRKLHLVKILVGLTTESIYVPVSVILELKGLSKGGLRTKDRLRFNSSSIKAETQEKIIDAMEIAENCKRALDYISDNMDYFCIITSTSKILRIKSPYSYITDDYFDPTIKNDDRILDSCKYLESGDLKMRVQDSPRRIFRRTVLVTGDRFLRIKTFDVDIPSRPLSSIIFWLASHHFPKIYAEMLKKSKEDRRKQYLKRKQNRDRRNKHGPAISNFICASRNN